MSNSLKLLSLNVGLFEKNNEALTSFLRDQKPDLLALQEVTRRIDSSALSAYISQPSIDLATTQLTHGFFAPDWLLKDFKKHNFHGEANFEVEFGGAIEFGNYVKSRFPISRAENRFVLNHFAYITDWSDWPENDSRAFQVVDIQLSPNQNLRLINYHGIWTKDKRGNTQSLKACKVISEVANQVECPTIICGDFNLFPDTESMRVFTHHFTSLVDTFSITTTRPSTNELHTQARNVVDYILVNDRVRALNLSVLDVDISDHLPLIAILEF